MNKEQLLKELKFKTVRSSGPGGQHVNKVATKVVLVFNVMDSQGLSEVEKERMLLKLSNRLTKAGVVSLQCDESRSQARNKELVLQRFFKLVDATLKVAKKRKKTKPSRAAAQKRLDAKKKRSLKKANRGKVDVG